ncbi:MAG TPA: DNA-processing protein DprA [Tepidisphaeraceae bacterium]|jgi:DNA processing protein
MALLHYLQLALTDSVGPITLKRMLEALGPADSVCRASLAQLRSVEGVGHAKAEKIHASLGKARAGAEAELERALGQGLTLICPEDEVYPLLLRSIPDPPAVLYVSGELEPRDLNAFALVGSRRCSYYGREQAERFAALLAGAGFTIVSGGARGVDSAAHRGAMQHAQGRTIAVLGCGLDAVYPPENKELFEQIARRGAVISEYPLGTPPLAENFPRRNRIVSGMSRGVLVIEADEKSGALITARQAADDHNRPVFALPGRVDNPLSAGPHKLIRDGATLARNLEDLLDGLDPLPQGAIEPTLFAQAQSMPHEEPIPSPQSAPPAIHLTDRQSRILSLMGSEPMNIDVIIDRASLSAQEVLQEMTLLTLRGQVRRVDGQTFVRRNFIKA